METGVFRELEDDRHLVWTRYRNSSGTAGSFLKATETIHGRKYYYKLSNYDPYRGIIGHECVNELIADRLLTILNISHLHYQLHHATIFLDGKEQETWLCVSENFRRKGESKLALDVFYQLHKKETESPLEFCLRMGWGDYISQMLIVDYLILNRDRHGANLEVLRMKENGSVRLAPLFDHGISLLFSCHSEEAARHADLLEDKPVQCFVGSQSAKRNLELLPGGYPESLTSLKAEDRNFILDGLTGSMPEEILTRTWEMIWERWCYFENLRHS